MEKGIIDINMPMNYKNPANESHAAMHSGWLDGMKKWSYKRMAANTTMVFNGNADGAVKQVQEARDKGLGIAGFAFSQGDHAEALGKKLGQAVFKEPVPVPRLSWKPTRKPSETVK
jgi:uncharacterized lipoprotein YddW (UPF0748 family)